MGPAPDPGCNCSLTVSVPVSRSPVSIRRFNVVSLILILIVLLKFFFKFWGLKHFKIILINFLKLFLAGIVWLYPTV